ncbi:type II toxin-antitoxin system RelE/ParE family toxin [Candidatus Contubernalis alkaliaceticus]|uniref:type II toxin-antitoxin system RelE/ParE family toxin n=1 Tax=Candidatus Contubernalis alkaliaceticus TaxID=338645 RepID=UPI001F4C520E|nr:type II toxin-antitoxin system RelE/ParE family toxin [Candidatus Contubernalis alkalaceticus]UNC93494.1 type II toxin-antitoxin system RelE/ParE family toxin [Candidatus Contubernalis alkalaceticus]
MEKYKINIYPAAKRDLKDIVDYINTLSPDAAVRKYDYIIEKIGSLSQMPERCPMIRDSQLRLKGYRMLIVNNYMVFFIVRDNTVQIRQILYGKMQYEWLL